MATKIGPTLPYDDGMVADEILVSSDEVKTFTYDAAGRTLLGNVSAGALLLDQMTPGTDSSPNGIMTNVSVSGSVFTFTVNPGATRAGNTYLAFIKARDTPATSPDTDFYLRMVIRVRSAAV